MLRSRKSSDDSVFGSTTFYNLRVVQEDFLVRKIKVNRVLLVLVLCLDYYSLLLAVYERSF